MGAAHSIYLISLPLRNNLNTTNNQNHDREGNNRYIGAPRSFRLRNEVIVAQGWHDHAHGGAEDASAEGEDFVEGVFQVHRTQYTEQEHQGPLHVFQPLARIRGLLTGAESVALKNEICDKNCQRVAEDEVDDESDLNSLYDRIVCWHHFHNNWLVECVAVSVVAQLGKAYVSCRQEAEGDGKDGRKLLPILGCAHDWHDAADALEHEEGEPDGIPVAFIVYRHEPHFFEVVMDYHILFRCPSSICGHTDHLSLRVHQLFLHIVHMVDVFTYTEGRDSQECYDDHCECKYKALFELFDFSDPGNGREEGQDNQAKVLLLQVLDVKY